MRPTPDTQPAPFLTFSLGTQRYAISIDEVIEVAAMVEVVTVAGAPAQVIGIINRHGSVLPMIDLRPVFRQASSKMNTSTLFIVAVHGEYQVGLVVDEVHQVEYLSAQQVTGPRLGEKYISAIISHRGELVQVITLPPLLLKILPEGFAKTFS